MSSWDAFIDNLLDGDEAADACIVGCEHGKESVWASHKTGSLGKITPEEIRKLTAAERSGLFSNGMTIAGAKCTVLRDRLDVDEECTMDIRTKASAQDPDTYNICIGKTKGALVIVKGRKDVHGGKVNVRTSKMTEHLKKAGY